MPFRLPPLPDAVRHLSGFLSKKTIEFHYGKHHRAYVQKLNQLTKGTPFATMDLEAVVRKSKGEIFNNAAQAWNHEFYWESLAAKASKPSAALKKELLKSFDSLGALKKKFVEESVGQFGSGWTWLVKKGGKIQILATHDADNPLTHGMVPLVACDLWEHAYYLDFQNAREKYVGKFWEHIDWGFVEENLAE